MKRLALFVFVICVFATNSPARAQVTRTVQVPLATYMGWNLRRAGFAEGEQCGLTGSFIPFAATEDDRLGSGDPRPSVEDRYRSHGGYVSRVVEAARRLQSQRFLLQEDATRIIEVAQRIGPSL